MQQVLELVTQYATANNGALLKSIAGKVGIENDAILNGVTALLPMVAAGIKSNVASNEGSVNLFAALQQGAHAAYVEDPNRLADDNTVEDGNKILGHVLGSKEASRAAAAEASQKTGIDTGSLKKLLPIVAAVTMGSLAKQQASAGPSVEQSAGSSVTDIVSGLAGNKQVQDFIGGLFN